MFQISKEEQNVDNFESKNRTLKFKIVNAGCLLLSNYFEGQMMAFLDEETKDMSGSNIKDLNYELEARDMRNKRCNS